ncbi:MAG: DegT/DnrJ/EryC1/StrS family aminotransferase [Bryobacteraceae bacterium]|jgi:dTDP-4-amino-4,6-dideoxygalactose transaminase
MTFRIPLFDLNFDDREHNAVTEALNSRWISMGPRVEAFERAFCGVLNGEHAVATSSGTAALHLALRILDIGAGDEVIVPSLTFVATINAIRYVNATPVFCDIKGAADLTVDPDLIPSLITKNTKAILVMHYGGFPCDMARVLAIAKKHNLQVIEDACHAPLSEYGGKKLGTLGEVGCFSFFANKTLSTGEGGMLVTSDEGLAMRARALRSHGMTTPSYDRACGHSSSYDVTELGYNYRLDDIRAAIGIAQLEKLPQDLIQRARVRALYIELLADHPRITIPFRDWRGVVSNYIFPVVLNEFSASQREHVRQKLAESGIQTSVHYPAAHRFDFYKTEDGRLPRTSYTADAEITLPLYRSLSDEHVRDVARALLAAIS